MPNSREWALFIWAAVFLAWTLSRKDLRHSWGDVLRAACKLQLLLTFGGMIAYTVAACWDTGTETSHVVSPIKRVIDAVREASITCRNDQPSRQVTSREVRRSRVHFR